MSERTTSSAAGGEIELAEIDLQFAHTIARLERGGSSELVLAAALASRATGNGDVCVHLADLAGAAVRELGVALPPLERWMRTLREHPAVGVPGEFRPLVLDPAGRLYLYRYWDYERRLADALLARAVDVEDVDEKLLRAGLTRYFPEAVDVEQKLAAAVAVLRKFCVISGGPGTGKTTTVVKILALLAEQAHGRRLAIGLAAPTGKAAARVQAALAAALERLDLDLFTRESMPREAATIHRLLGARPNSASYRYGRDHRLPLDVLVVDEASMADLALAVKLVEALPAHARLILLGDKDQLASVEAGAVLGDICRSGGYTTLFAKRLSSVASVPTARLRKAEKSACPLTDSIALLERSYRFGPQSGIGALARAVNAGDSVGALALLENASSDVAWRTVGPGELKAQLAVAIVERLRPYFRAVRGGEAPKAVLARFDALRVLCAHRSGHFGVTAVNRTIEDALDAAHLINARQGWYAGRAVMITQNDYSLRLFNGDIGIALPDPREAGRFTVFFPSGVDGVRAVAPARLPQHETVYAMTIHKSQGSEFGEVLMVLPAELSAVMSRELVYTGITRAMRGVEIWGTQEAFSAAIERRLVRASALQERLWGAATSAA